VGDIDGEQSMRRRRRDDDESVPVPQLDPGDPADLALAGALPLPAGRGEGIRQRPWRE
jgi:hypothetical protein